MSTYCEVCSLDLDDENAYDTHITEEKHLRNYQQQEFQKKILENSVYVSPIPACTTSHKLIEHFLQYGTIETYKLGTNHIILSFQTSEPVDYLLSHPIWINTTKLDIRKSVFNDPKKDYCPDSSDKPSVIDFNSIKNVLEKEPTFERKLVAFMNTVLLNDTEIEPRHEITCKSLTSMLEPLFPNCHTYIFGSTQTGLGFKDCDLDLYMNIGVPISDTGDTQWSMKKVFKEVKTVMYKMNNIFAEIVPILKAKTPIIKFYHIPTKISCDISFRNDYGVHNGNLIKYYLSLDARVKPLITIIKYWARQCKISGCGKISNYALIMLVIFYLQQTEPKVLPSVMDLQETCTIPIIVNGWQVNIDQNATLPPCTNTGDVPNLLLGFFQYYINFQFKTNIVCPWDGLLHTKEEFAIVSKLPDYMARYKRIATTDDLKLNISKLMCIQDPIELNRNVVASTSQRYVTLFQKYCDLGTQVCTSERTSDNENLLEHLFSAVSKLDNTDTQIVVALYAGPYLIIGEPDNIDERTDVINKEQFIKDKWYFLIYTLVKDIFERVYRLKVVVVLSREDGGRHKRRLSLLDTDTKLHQEFWMHCTGTECTWYNRKCGVGYIDPELSSLDKEAMITERMVEENNKKGTLRKINLDFMCKFEKKDDPVYVQLELFHEGGPPKLFKEFSYLARDKIRKIAMNTLSYMLDNDIRLNEDFW